MPFGWVDNATPYLNAANLESMFNGGPWVFTPEQYGAVRNGSTDDTAAIQSAINAAVAYAISSGTYYAEVLFSPGIYQVSSATTKGGTTFGNAQITLPIVQTLGQKVILVLRGIRDSSAFYHWWQTSTQLAGAVIRTTLTGLTLDGTWGAPSIIGAQTAWADPNGVGSNSFSNMLLHVDGLTIQAPTNPGIIGIDAGGVAQCNVGTLACLTTATPAAMKSGGYGTNTLGVGLKMPNINNNDNCNVDNYCCEGWCYGMIASDHTNVFRFAAIYCSTALFIANQSTVLLHGMTLHYMSVEGGLKVAETAASAGGFPFTINLVDCEQQTGTFDFVDVNNTLYGTVNFTDGTGRIAKLSGATNLSVYNQLQPHGSVTAPTVPATTVALSNPFHRNAAVSITAGASTCTVTIDGVSQMVIPSAGVECLVVPANDPITLTYTAAPTWKWILF